MSLYKKSRAVKQNRFCVKCRGAVKFSHCKIICIFAFCRMSEVPRASGFSCNSAKKVLYDGRYTTIV